LCAANRDRHLSDARLRELEKDAARGEPGAQVRLLVERMRTGGLTQERVELAAYCGDTAARMATGTLCPGGPDGGHTGFCDEQCGVYVSFPSWARALSRWTDDPERLIACACACAEIASEERVRVALSAALIAWALS